MVRDLQSVSVYQKIGNRILARASRRTFETFVFDEQLLR